MPCMLREVKEMVCRLALDVKGDLEPLKLWKVLLSKQLHSKKGKTIS